MGTGSPEVRERLPKSFCCMVYSTQYAVTSEVSAPHGRTNGSDIHSSGQLKDECFVLPPRDAAY